MASGISALQLEAICNQLNSNPAAATAALTAIRDAASPSSTTLSLLALLLSCEQSHLSPNAIFQCLNIVQFNIAKYWLETSNIFSSNKEQIENSIWIILQRFVDSSNGNGKYPPFLLNKLIQMYCLLWKLSWCGYEKDVIQNLFFAKVFALISNSNHAMHIKVGTTILREVVEQFNNKSFVEINLPIDFHKKCHKHFEFFGLDESFQASFQIFTYNIGTLSQILSGGGNQISDLSGMTDKIQAFIENIKLFNEIINWEFNENNNKLLRLNSSLSNNNNSSSSDVTNERASIDVPIAWIETIFGSNLIGNILSSYDIFSNILSSNRSSCTNSNGSQAVVSLLSEIRIFLLTLSSISENSFKNENERIFFVNFLLEKIVLLIDSNNNLVMNNVVIVNDVVYSEKNGEIENFANMLLKIFNNFDLQIIQKASSYNTLISKLCLCTLARSNAISLFNNTANGANAALKDSYGIKNNNGFFFDTFNWNITTIFLTILQIIVQYNFNYESGANGVNETVKQCIASASDQLFQLLFDNFLTTAISVAIAESVQDEDEEIEEIDTKIVSEIIYLISHLGKINVAGALDHISNIISSTIGECQNNLDNNSFIVLQNVRILETMRLCLVFATHVCDDTYYDEIANTSAVASTSSSRIASIGNYSTEDKLIPSIIIDYLLSNTSSQSAIEAVVLSLRNIAKNANYILEMQLFLMDSNRRSDLIFSPFLISSIMTFFRRYMQIYVDPQPALYSVKLLNKVGLYILSIHGTSDEAGNPNNDFNIIISTIFNSIHKIMFYIPLEVETVVCSSVFISTLSRSVAPNRLSFMSSLGTTLNIMLEIVTNISDNRLNDEGIMNLFNCFSNFSIRTNNYNMFMLLCESLAANMASVAALLPSAAGSSSSRASPDVYRLQYTKTLAALRGVSACCVGAGEDAVIQDLFDSALPLVTSLTPGSYASCDDILMSHFMMLRDYAEHQLNKLRKKSTNTLYRASYAAILMFRERLKYSSVRASAGNNDSNGSLRDAEESSAKNDLLLIMLELLNHLSTKDFLLDFDDVSTPHNGHNGISGSASEETIEVPTVLLNGMQVIVPVIDVAMLRDYPRTCDRYYSFTAFMCSTYSTELPSAISSQAPPTVSGDEHVYGFLNVLIQHLLWAAGAIDSTTARLALQSLQALATHHVTTIRSNISSGPGPFGQVVLAQQLFPLAMRRLLEMILFPMSCEYGVTMDRIDACANALITLITADVDSFKSCVNMLISQQPPQYQQQLLACFEQLISANGVDVLKIDRRNRLIFAKNMREFITTVRGLLMTI